MLLVILSLFYILAYLSQSQFSFPKQQGYRLSSKTVPASEGYRRSLESNGNCFKIHVQNPVDIPLYWLVDRDPYNGLL